MSLIIVVSVLIRFVATIWSLAVIWRSRDLRVLLLTAMLVLMTARQILTLAVGFAAGAELRLEVETHLDELPGLVVSLLAFLLVLNLERITAGGSVGLKRRASSRTGEMPILPALVIGLASVFAVVAISYLAYDLSRDAIRQAVADRNLALGRTMCSVAFDESTHTEGADSRESLDRLNRIWEQTKAQYQDSYLCVVGPSGRLTLHTLSPELQGTDVGQSVVSEKTGQTVMELLRAHKDWSGQNVNIRGVRQLVGYHYDPSIDSLVTLHVPTQVVDEGFAKAVDPWIAGTALIAGLLLPCSLGLLYYSSRLANDRILESLNALRVSEQRYRRLVDNSPYFIFEFESDGTISSVNRAALDQAGVSNASGILGANSLDKISEEDRPRISQLFQQALAGQISRFEVTSRRGYVFESCFVPEIDENGNVSRIMAIAQDISERKRAEKALRESERFFRSIFEQAAVGVAQLDSDAGIILHVNRKYCQLLDASAEDLVGKTWMELTHPDDLAVDSQNMERLRSGEIRDFSIEKRLQRTDGSYIWISLTVSPMWQPGEEATTHIAIVEDITFRKDAEASLHLRDHAFASSSNGIVIVDANQDDLPIIYCNPTFLRMTGYSEEEVVGRNCRFLQRGDREQPGLYAIRKAVQRGQEVNTTIRNYRKDGTMFWCELRISPVHDANGRLTHFLGFQIDVTKRIQQELLYRTIVESTQEWIWEIDLHGVHTFSNPAVETLLGFSVGEIVGGNSLDRLQEEDRRAVEDKLPRLVAEKQGWTGWLLRWRHKDGSIRYLESNANPMLDDRGQLIGFRGADRDVTERVKTEEALRLSEERNRSLVTMSAATIWFTDPEGRFSVAQPMWEEFTGQPWEEHQGYGWARMLHRDDSERIMKTWHDAIEHRYTYSNYGRIFHAATGQYRYCDVYATPLRNPDGSIREWFGITIDAHDRKFAETKLLEQHELTEHLLSTMLDGYILADSAGTLLDVNPAYCDMVGYHRNELRSINLKELEGALPQGEIKRRIAVIVQAGQMRFETAHRHRDGHLVDLDVSISALPRHGSEGPSIAAFVRDITDRKRKERQLQFTKYSVDTCSIPIFWIRIDGSFSYFNDAALRHLGYPRDKLHTMGVPDIDPAYPAEVWPEFWGTLRREKTLTFETGTVHQDGSIIPVEITTNYLEFGGQEHCFAFVTDITDRKRGEQAMLENARALRELNVSLEERVLKRTAELADTNAELTSFAHTVSHDLRAPLRAMEGFAIALREDYGERLDEQGHEFIEHIVVAAQRMDQLVTELLAYSRLGRDDLAMNPISLDSVIREVRDQLSADLSSDKIKLVVAEQLATVMGHRPTIMQVVTNLLANAIKFVAPGVSPEIRVWTEAKKDGNIRLWVEDNGIGIDQEYQRRIFHVFERLHGIESYPGTGIGLAVVARACDRLGGRCGVESQLGQGSRFWVELPRGETRR